MSITSLGSSSKQRLLTECCHCGFLNYDDSLSCLACAQETDLAVYINSENDSYSDSVSTDYEPTPSNSADFNTFISVSEPEQVSEPVKQTPKKKQITVMNFIANDNISYETNSQIFVSNIPEDMANENLGNAQLFGMFGDIKQISIIRDRISVNPTAKITFYSIDSIVELMKLSIAYDASKCKSKWFSNSIRL